MPTSLGDWLWGDPLQGMKDDALADLQAKYGTNLDQPRLRSVDDPPAEKAFHDDRESWAFPGGTTAFGGAMGGNAPLGARKR